LLFVSGVISPVTQELSVNTRLYLANTIGMNAAVLPNEYNTLNTQLQTRAQELEQREIAVALKEKKSATFDISTFTLSIILFVMLILLVLNYVLDFLRVQSKKTMTIQNEKMA
jgi:hypothetical protein